MAVDKIAEYSAKNKRNEIGESYGYSLKWRLYANRIRNNPVMRDRLLSRQKLLCPICENILDEETHMHHIDYDHICNYGRETEVYTGSISKRTKKRRVKLVPDCESCLVNSKANFNSCKNKLVMVHKACHGRLHSESKNRTKST